MIEAVIERAATEFLVSIDAFSFKIVGDDLLFSDTIIIKALFCFVLFAIFILHSRESELYRYTLDGKSALAWELPFYGSPVFHIKVGRPVKCLAQGHNKRTCWLVLHNLP